MTVHTIERWTLFTDRRQRRAEGNCTRYIGKQNCFSIVQCGNFEVHLQSIFSASLKFFRETMAVRWKRIRVWQRSVFQVKMLHGCCFNIQRTLEPKSKWVHTHTHTHAQRDTRTQPHNHINAYTWLPLSLMRVDSDALLSTHDGTHGSIHAASLTGGHVKHTRHSYLAVA